MDIFQYVEQDLGLPKTSSAQKDNLANGPVAVFLRDQVDPIGQTNPPSTIAPTKSANARCPRFVGGGDVKMLHSVNFQVCPDGF